MNGEEALNHAALAAIKEAHKKGRRLSSEEAIEFISRPMYLGSPKALQAKARGRKPMRTQYDAAFERRKNLHRKLVKLPQLRIKAAVARRAIGDPLRELVLQLADELTSTTPRYKLASAILRYLDEHPRLHQPDIKTVRTILNKSFKPMR